VKRALVLTGLLAVAAVIGAIAYRSSARDRGYRTLINSGEAALAAAETRAAIEDFSGAIPIRPDAMLARLRRGETYRRRGELEIAARDFRAAAALDPTATRPLEALGDVLYAQERFKRAAETYDSRLRLDDRSAPIRYKLALARYREGSIDAALTEARRAIALDPPLADAHYLAALCLRDGGRPDEAVTALQEAIQHAPAMLPAREELVDVLRQLHRGDEELEQLRQLAKIDGAHVERQIALALAEARLGDGDQAIAILELAATRTSGSSPSPVDAAIGKVWLQLAEADRERPEAISKALESLERAASALDATSETKALYGRALALSGQLEAAEQLFQQAIERYPLDPAALHDLAGVAERLGHLDTAREALVQYASLVTDDADAAEQALHIGLLAARAGDPGGALPWLQRALESRPEDVPLLCAIADAQIRTGDAVGARASTLRALALDPANAVARDLGRQVRRMEKEKR
jgi:tetratricopeptide (TPR) repeat protein